MKMGQIQLTSHRPQTIPCPRTAPPSPTICSGSAGNPKILSAANQHSIFDYYGVVFFFSCLVALLPAYAQGILGIVVVEKVSQIPVKLQVIVCLLKHTPSVLGDGPGLQQNLLVK